MPSREYVFRSVYGAWRLARLDPAGMNFFDLTIAGFWRSFFVAVLVVPFYIVLALLDYPSYAEAGVDTALYLLVKLVSYVVGWAAFPLAMLFLARLLSLGAYYVPFIIAYNWAVTIQMAAFLPLALLGVSGVLPESLHALLAMAVTVAVLFYQWFVARTALGASALTAAGIVLVDVLLTVLIESQVGAML